MEETCSWPTFNALILVYCNSEGVKSSKKIEKMCNYDIRILYLQKSKKAPYHSTVNKFKNRLKPFVESIFLKNNKFLIDNEFLDLSSIYIDGTKIESYVNKYTLVWKKSVNKFKNNLVEKIKKYFNLVNEVD